jgi:hypothetical protein
MERAIFLCGGDRFGSVYPQYIKDEIKKDWSITDRLYSYSDVGVEDFTDVVAVFSTWGMAKLAD